MKIFFFLLTISLIYMQNSAFAEGNSTHSAYRVTSYNLGVISDSQDSETSRNSINFKPLLITSTTSDILNSEHQGKASWAETIPHPSSANGVALSATFDATQNISLQGAFGLTRNLWAPDALIFEKESSWEANLGIIYKLVKNLSYELHFGYMDTGNLFTDRSSYTNVESIIMISNQLTMSF
jgi:hypothetical protein